MQTLELNKMGLAPMEQIEMQELDGGLLPFLVIGACVLLAGCVQKNDNTGSGVQVNVQTNAQNIGDSINNKNQGTLSVKPK